MEKITYLEEPITEDNATENEDYGATNELDEKDSQLFEELSADSLGRWNRLISRTNWEKGELIHRWRTRLRDAGFSNAFYSDEIWAKRVGNVSPQHVGRLRRVFERFGENGSSFASLYWSHFQAALDWDDADQWLSEASNSQWSVATMRIKRWETLGEPMELKPKERDVILSELDEDVNPYNDSHSEMILEGSSSRIEPTEKKQRSDEDDIPFDPNDVEPFDGEHGGSTAKNGNGKESKEKSAKNTDDSTVITTGEALAKLGTFNDLPDDLREACEQLKIALLSHKLSGWKDVEQQRVLSLLNILRTVVIAKED